MSIHPGSRRPPRPDPAGVDSGGGAPLRAMVAGLSAILWERDPETLRIRFINARAEELLGHPTEQWLSDGELASRIVHPDDRDAVLARLQRAVAEDDDFTMSYRAQAADGRWLWLQHLGHVARDEAGVATALHAVLFDVTEQRRREQVAVLLAAAGQALAGGEPVEQRLDAVAGLALPLLGERAVVWLAGDDSRYRMAAAAPVELAEQVRDLPPVLAPEELRPRIAAGRAFTVGPFPEQVRREALAGDAALERLAAADPTPRRQLVVPLQHGGHGVGLLTFFTADLSRRFDAEDLALAEDLGQRIAAMVAAERVTARQRQLHEITAALSGAGTVAEAAAALTTGLRRALGASVVALCTLGQDGLLHTVDARGYPAENGRSFATMRLSAPVPPADAARTGRPVWLPDRAAVAERYPQAAAHLLASTQGAAALPLLAQGRVVGALGVTFTTPRRFDTDERAFLRAVADQVAVAVERAALADVRREMAETLQRSLLPARLPELDGLQVVTRYLPAVRGTAAGGDWYDLHGLADGTVTLAVGDIVGDGAPAAAVMGQLRSSLGALLLAGHPPAEALTLLDLIADGVPGSAVSTVACMRLDPVTGALTYSRAGHLPPLLVDTDGAASWLDQGRGPVLGLPDRRPRPEATTALPAGATLLLYTDGLVERRNEDLDVGLQRLCAAAVTRCGAPLDALVDGLLADLVGSGGAADDIAIVAVRRVSRG